MAPEAAVATGSAWLHCAALAGTGPPSCASVWPRLQDPPAAEAVLGLDRPRVRRVQAEGRVALVVVGKLPSRGTPVARRVDQRVRKPRAASVYGGCRKMSAMQAARSLVAAVLALVVVGMPTVVQADDRVALVVGNSTYAHIGRLPNPDNDAVDISAALRRLGFEVTTELDADRVELTEALRQFTRQSAGADVSLVFSTGSSAP